MLRMTTCTTTDRVFTSKRIVTRPARDSSRSISLATRRLRTTPRQSTVHPAAAPERRTSANSVRPANVTLEEIIPEGDATLESVTAVGGRFVARYLRDARSELRVLDRAGSLQHEIELPVAGTVTSLFGRDDDPRFFYSFSSYIYPTTIYSADAAAGTSEVFRAPDVDFDPALYVVKQEFYASPDGTPVPMFIAHRKDLSIDGERPVYLYGYGGFNQPITPTFSVPNLVWLELGGVYAVANIRGGGEYGEEWHRAGTKLQKQNVFDDFIAAGEWLIANGYTKPERLSIGGRSNGGLLVGACITQRPELYGGALAGVGVLDMLRFHKFTIGWAWVSDYGSPDVEEEFRALYAYSPYHNLQSGTSYPATLLATADHDDRVVPAHSYKFAAALQAAQGGAAPAIIRIDTKAGHGAGKPLSMRIDEWVDSWAFLISVLGFEPILPSS